ncbi:MAG: sulfite exporter TauE/SafE family protein [Microthrixaceae bacterium]|nr:sulfite exporter TauE/SafE family protein [Microthrixaceae bacterium]MCO5318777.1 sulfite exporter TauE/SafE family protein [Microthrixaceae bacterium]
MPDPGALAVVFLAVLTGAFVNALAGFGFALTTVPLITLAIGPKQAVVVSALVGFVSNSAVLVRNHEAVEKPQAKRLVAGAYLGMPVGVVVLSRIAEAPLQVSIALVVLGVVALYGAGWTPGSPGPALEVLAGVASGALNTSVGISGPPVVLTLSGRGSSKAAFRATSVAVFAVTGVGALVLFGLAGRYGSSVLVAAAVAMPAIPAGIMVGERVHLGVPEARFRSIVLVLLALTATVTLYNAVAG